MTTADLSVIAFVAALGAWCVSPRRRPKIEQYVFPTPLGSKRGAPGAGGDVYRDRGECGTVGVVCWSTLLGRCDVEIGKEQRVVRVAPEPFPMGEPQLAPKEAPAEVPEPVLVPR